MTIYVIKAKPEYTGVTFTSDGYYTGNRYIYEGEQYAVVERELSSAKRYSSMNRAEAAAKAITRSVVNHSFEAKALEVKDE